MPLELLEPPLPPVLAAAPAPPAGAGGAVRLEAGGGVTFQVNDANCVGAPEPLFANTATVTGPVAPVGVHVMLPFVGLMVMPAGAPLPRAKPLQPGTSDGVTVCGTPWGLVTAG